MDHLHGEVDRLAAGLQRPLQEATVCRFALGGDALPGDPVAEGPRVVAMVEERRAGQVRDSRVEGVGDPPEPRRVVTGAGVVTGDEHVGTPARERPGAEAAQRLRDPYLGLGPGVVHVADPGVLHDVGDGLEHRVTHPPGAAHPAPEQPRLT